MANKRFIRDLLTFSLWLGALVLSVVLCNVLNQRLDYWISCGWSVFITGVVFMASFITVTFVLVIRINESQ